MRPEVNGKVHQLNNFWLGARVSWRTSGKHPELPDTQSGIRRNFASREMIENVGHLEALVSDTETRITRTPGIRSHGEEES